MPWKLIIPGKSAPDRDAVTFNKDSFMFNTHFSKKQNLAKYCRVRIFVDPQAQKIGFQFLINKNEPNSLRFFQTRSQMATTSRKVANDYPWIAKVADLPCAERQFTPIKEGDLWTIDLNKKNPK